jgi:hypothetical protein
MAEPGGTAFVCCLLMRVKNNKMPAWTTQEWRHNIREKDTQPSGVSSSISYAAEYPSVYSTLLKVILINAILMNAILMNAILMNAILMNVTIMKVILMNVVLKIIKYKTF